MTVSMVTARGANVDSYQLISSSIQQTNRSFCNLILFSNDLVIFSVQQRFQRLLMKGGSEQYIV